MARNQADPPAAASDAATYSVKPSSAAGSRVGAQSAVAPEAVGSPAPAGTAAVYVVHGMGGQLQFQTLTDIADGLRQASVRFGGAPSGIASRAVGVGDDRLQRMELTLSNGTSTRVVHVYEAYWAPITEGEVTLRDVIRFLFKAGFDGLWHSALPFMRFLDQKYVAFPVPVRTPLFLLMALLVTLSLVVMNVSIVGLAAMRMPWKIAASGEPSIGDTNAPGWATASLFRDVTAILDLFVVAAVVFGLLLLPSIAWRAWLRSANARRWRKASKRAPTIVPAVTLLAGSPSIVSFVLLLAATVAAGVALPLVIYFHTMEARTFQPAVSILDLAFAATDVDGLLRGASMLLLTLTGAAIVIAAALAVFRILRGLGGALQAHGSGKQFWLTMAVLGGTAAVIGGGVFVGLRLAPHIPHADLFDVSGNAGLSLVWLLAVGVSALARRFLVAYVGDVAAYIQPQQLDRFNRLRTRVKGCVWASARAVYRSPEKYDEIVVVGHSLGSLIGYDVLNRLYREEELGTVPGVQARSKLFVTFGSPLDKTAFLFAIQGSNREGREALAASVQPLIGFPSRRPRWVNVYSGWDIISGSLDFYDKSATSPRRVENQSDPEACVWLAAHTEYWDGQLVFDTIHQHLVP